MYAKLLIVLGLACWAQATCRRPTPMNNFSHKNFSGKWYKGAFTMLDKRDEIIYRYASCPRVTFEDTENVQKNFEVQMTINGTSELRISGTYTVPDPSKGFFKENTLGLANTYECTVMCTDYVFYAATYVCVEVADGYTTEWIVLNLRDYSKYDEIVAKKELENCYSELPIKSAKELTKRPFTNCEGFLSGLLELVNSLLKGLGSVVSGLLGGLFGN